MTAAEAGLVLALLAQFGWTFVVMTSAGRARFRAACERRLKGDIALTHDGWPDDVRKLGNNMNNQFETPTLFYALGLLALVIGAAGTVVAVLAWAYVATRVVHTAIHTGSNVVIRRFQVFLAGVGCLMAMTAYLAVHTILELAAG